MDDVKGAAGKNQSDGTGGGARVTHIYQPSLVGLFPPAPPWIDGNNRLRLSQSFLLLFLLLHPNMVSHIDISLKTCRPLFLSFLSPPPLYYDVRKTFNEPK